jgi:hypothetical protein
MEWIVDRNGTYLDRSTRLRKFAAVGIGVRDEAKKWRDELKRTINPHSFRYLE